MRKFYFLITFILCYQVRAQQGLVGEFSGHTGCVYDICISTNGKYLASASQDNTVKLWDIEKGRLIKSNNGTGEELYAVCFDETGEQLITAGRGGDIIKVNWKTGFTATELNFYQKPVTRSLAFGYGNVSYFAAESDNLEIHYKDKTVKNISLAQNSYGNIFSIRHMDKKNALILACQTGLVKIDTEGKIYKIPGSSPTFSTDVSIDSNYMLAGLTDFDVYDLNTFHKIKELKDYNDFSFKEQMFSVAFNPTGTLVVAGYETGEVVVWDVQSKELIKRFMAHNNFACNNGAGKMGKFMTYNGGINAIKFMPDGKRFFTCGNDNSIKLWSIDSLVPRQFIGNNRNEPLSIKLTYPLTDTITISNFGLDVRGYAENPIGRVYVTVNGNDAFVDPKTREFDSNVFLEGMDNKITILAHDDRPATFKKEITVLKTGLANFFNKETDYQKPKRKKETVIPVKPVPPKEPVSLEEMKMARIYAVVVGVSQYMYDDNIQLNYAAKDAVAYAEFLKSARGGNVPNDQITVLIDSMATRENILEAFEQTLERTGRDDIFIYYYSGHGMAVGNNEALSFLCYDTKTRNSFKLKSTSVMQDELLKLVNASPVRKKLMFVDACYSGLFATRGQKDAGNINSRLLLDMSKAEATLTIFTSSSNNEKSFEDESLEGGHGIFTYYLLEGLKGKADNENGDKNGFVTVFELEGYLKEKVNQRALQIEKQTQRPNVYSVSGNDFPLSEPGAKKVKEK